MQHRHALATALCEIYSMTLLHCNCCSLSRNKFPNLIASASAAEDIKRLIKKFTQSSRDMFLLYMERAVKLSNKDR